MSRRYQRYQFEEIVPRAVEDVKSLIKMFQSYQKKFKPSHSQDSLKHRELIDLVVDNVMDDLIKCNESSSSSNPSTAMN